MLYGGYIPYSSPIIGYITGSRILGSCHARGVSSDSDHPASLEAANERQLGVSTRASGETTTKQITLCTFFADNVKGFVLNTSRNILPFLSCEEIWEK